MTFEQTLRDKIQKAPFRSAEKEILKVVLGEYQQKTATAKATDEIGHTIVKKMIAANKENLGLLPNADPRCAQFNQENIFLNQLLPQYWSQEQIVASLTEASVDVKTAANDGQAMGVAMQHLKKVGAPVEGQTVKEAVATLRKVSI